MHRAFSGRQTSFCRVLVGLVILKLLPKEVPADRKLSGTMATLPAEHWKSWACLLTKLLQDCEFDLGMILQHMFNMQREHGSTQAYRSLRRLTIRDRACTWPVPSSMPLGYADWNLTSVTERSLRSPSFVYAVVMIANVVAGGLVRYGRTCRVPTTMRFAMRTKAVKTRHIYAGDPISAKHLGFSSAGS